MNGQFRSLKLCCKLMNEMYTFIALYYPMHKNGQYLIDSCSKMLF